MAMLAIYWLLGQYYFEYSIIQEYYGVPNHQKSLLETHACHEIHDSFKRDNNEKHQLLNAQSQSENPDGCQ